MSATLQTDPSRAPDPPAPSRGGPTLREGLIAFAVALVAAFVVLGYNIVHGAFMWDDWQWASLLREPLHGGLLGNAAPQVAEFRPLLADWIALVFRVFGTDAHWHLAFIAVLAACTALAFYVLLRTLGIARAHAGLIAVLILIFPWSDSTRVYTVNGMNMLPVCLFVAGLIVSLRGLRRSGRRAVVLACVGAALYVLSIVIYEVAATAALGTIVLYLLVAPPRRALARWALDLVVVGASILYVRGQTDREVHTLRESLGHAHVIFNDAIALGRHALLPFGRGLALAFALVLVALLVVGIVRVLRGSLSAGAGAGAGAGADSDAGERDGDRAQLRRWLITAVVAGILLGLSYLVFAPGDRVYRPSADGIGNRVNILAALGYVALVYAVLMIVATLATAPASRWRRALAPALVAVVAIGWGVQFMHDMRDYAHASDRRDAIVATIRAHVHDPVEHAIVYTFGESLYQAKGIPVFSGAWDLRGAVRMIFDDRSLRALPARSNTVWACRENLMYPKKFSIDTGKTYSTPYGGGVAYGLAIFVDARLDRAEVIDSRQECLDASRRYLVSASRRFSLARQRQLRVVLENEATKRIGAPTRAAPLADFVGGGS